MQRMQFGLLCAFCATLQLLEGSRLPALGSSKHFLNLTNGTEMAPLLHQLQLPFRYGPAATQHWLNAQVEDGDSLAPCNQAPCGRAATAKAASGASYLQFQNGKHRISQR
jgi:hypothetical protein